jgi:hypothetical protein
LLPWGRQGLPLDVNSAMAPMALTTRAQLTKWASSHRLQIPGPAPLLWSADMKPSHRRRSGNMQPMGKPPSMSPKEALKTSNRACSKLHQRATMSGERGVVTRDRPAVSATRGVVLWRLGRWPTEAGKCVWEERVLAVGGGAGGGG